MPLDPQVKQIIAEDTKLGLPAYHRLSPFQARHQMLDTSPPVNPKLSASQVKDMTIPGFDTALPIRCYYPPGDPPFPVAVYFHGGGWIMGNLDTHHAICHALAHSSDCLVVAVDYRLAPENKFPAATQDAYTATCWVSDNADHIGADALRMAIMGESAGATLSTVTCMMIRERGGPRLALQVLVYPVTDCSFHTRSHEKYADGYMLTREMMNWIWDQYLTDKRDAEHPHVSPLRAESLRDLPPALVLTAEYDPLCDEGEAYAGRLMADGVKVRHSPYEGMVHGFFRMTDRLDRSRQALQEVSSALKKALND